MDKYYVGTFHSVHEALNFEKALKEANIKHQMIPVPREISSSCGLAVKFSPEDKSKVDDLVASKNLLLNNFYLLEAKAKKSLLDKIKK